MSVTLSPKTCSICLETFNLSPTNKKTLDCTHVFHKECISKWLEQRQSCPLCKKFVVPIIPTTKKDEVGMKELTAPLSPLSDDELLLSIRSDIGKARRLRSPDLSPGTSSPESASKGKVVAKRFFGAKK